MSVFKALNAFIAAAIFLGSALAARQYVVLRIMPQGGPARAQARQAVARGEEVQPDASRYDDIFAGGVFGKGKFTVLGSVARGAAPGAARGDIALVGTAVGGRGYAIFQETQSRRQALVEKGEEVFNIGVLTRIERDRAFVLSNGREVVFYMPAEEKPEGAPPVAAPGGRPPFKGVVAPQGGNGPGWIIDRRALDDVLANTDKLLTDARLLPYSDKGRTSGFTISEIKPGGLFSLMGFVNGDVILKVNDYGIDSPEKAAQILSGIKGESSVTLDILRDGRPKRLSYQIR
ncbi:MAG: PDZ domain-containing protein [Deltaproteobacteria bacterium]|nr:PDZ domain-containing protein [Deltaproteobacteria bacterium]